jgi:hypothetical protein
MKTICAEITIPIVVSSYDKWKFSYDIGLGALRDHFQAASLSGFGLEQLPRRHLRRRGAASLLKGTEKKRPAPYFRQLPPGRSRNTPSSIPRPSATSNSCGPCIPTKSTVRWCRCSIKQARPWGAGSSSGSSRGRSSRSAPSRNGSPAWNGSKRIPFARGEVELQLKRIADIERLIGRVVFERANGRDLLALAAIVQRVSPILSARCNQPGERSSKTSPLRSRV